MQNQTIDWKKYVFVFIITAIIFASAIYMSNYFGQKKIDEIRGIQDKISIDILSSETQFSLLADSSCSNFDNGDALSTELGSLEDKLSFAEKNSGTNNADILTLKNYYSLLEIKDYLLMKQISLKCKKTPLNIIYFYSTDSSCSDCQKEGYVLTQLRQDYPELRIYSFDYNLDLSAVKTLVKIGKVKNSLPAIFIDDKAYYGFQSTDDIMKAMPELKALADAKNATSTTATSTSKK